MYCRIRDSFHFVIYILLLPEAGCFEYPRVSALGPSDNSCMTKVSCECAMNLYRFNCLYTFNSKVFRGFKEGKCVGHINGCVFFPHCYVCVR